ncbi:MAG: methylenetetrahydromethanopterin dehydrogenase [Rhodospirillales bacterium]|nr:methylenetetrahydromethanopterin dehydrogenase [Rhodospirillales bacterium]
MEKPRVLHFLTPLPHLSPFDVNMACDAGFTVAGYTGIALKDINGLTQDAMFSRAPQDAAKTVLFIGGRDAMLALDMAAGAKKAMFPPFEISVFADPSGAFTTAAAMVALVEKHLRRAGHRLEGAKVVVFGAKGVVGGVVGILAAEAGAEVDLVGYDQTDVVPRKAEEFGRRFGHRFCALDGSTEAGRRAALAPAEVVLAAAKAGVQVLSSDDLAAAPRLRVAADINAVPPAGIEGVDAKADGAPLASGALGIGALAIGNLKFRVQHGLLRRLHSADKAQFIDHLEAFRLARELAAGN